MAIAALNWWAALAPIKAVKNEITALAAAASAWASSKIPGRRFARSGCEVTNMKAQPNATDANIPEKVAVTVPGHGSRAADEYRSLLRDILICVS
nr:hypothetical protein [uncultured Hyphomonas sp.]